MSQYLLRFDGVNDRVDWGRTTAFPTVNAVVEVEIELKSLTGTYQTFVGSVNGNAASDAFFLLGVNASGNPFLQCGGSGLASAKSVTGVSPLALNTKYTVRAEFAGMSAASNANQGTASLYINGVLIGTFTPNSRPFRDTNIGIGVLGLIDTSLFPANFDLYNFTFQTDTENRFYDPSASNGTGTTLFDTVGGNNGTLVNFTVPDCWVLIPSAGVTADGNFTFPALTLSGEASATLPAFTANGDFTLPVITLSGAASASLPQPIATGDFALPSLALSGVASATLPNPIANGDFTLPSLTLSGNASATLPQPQITGSFTLPSLSISGVVHVTQPNFNIVGNFTMPALTMSGEASATQPQPSINGSFTLPTISVSGTASATLPNPVAVGEFTLSALTLNGSASVTEPVFTVNGNFTLPSLTLSGQASATLPQPIANGSFTLPAIQISGVAIIGGVAIISTDGNTIIEPALSNIIYEPTRSNTLRV